MHIGQKGNPISEDAWETESPKSTSSTLEQVVEECIPMDKLAALIRECYVNEDNRAHLAIVLAVTGRDLECRDAASVYRA
jgi:hypothetical protein